MISPSLSLSQLYNTKVIIPQIYLDIKYSVDYFFFSV